jgi:hypothetical protein
MEKLKLMKVDQTNANFEISSGQDSELLNTYLITTCNPMEQAIMMRNVIRITSSKYSSTNLIAFTEFVPVKKNQDAPDINTDAS